MKSDCVLVSVRSFLAVTLLGLGLMGCATPKNNTFESHHIYLDSPEAQANRMALFLEGNPEPNEEMKINYLLDSILHSEDKFIRNGMEYNSVVAIQWLKWKRNHKQFKQEPVLTADDFVRRVATRSNKTGEVYGLILQGGQRTALGNVLLNELFMLEKEIAERKKESVNKVEVPAAVGGDSKLSDSMRVMKSAPLETRTT